MKDVKPPAPLYIWILKIPEDLSPAAFSGIRNKLSPDKQKRLDKMGSRPRQIEFAASHALARLKIAEILGENPAPLPLSFPEGKSPRLATPYSLSISHSAGLVAVAFASCPVGIDIEIIKERPQGEKIAQRYFSPEEISAMKLLTGEEWMKRFSELWTLKEAYFKASGLSITEVVKQTSFEIKENKVFTLQSATPWQFSLFYPDPTTVMAYVIKSDGVRQNPPAIQWATNII